MLGKVCLLYSVLQDSINENVGKCYNLSITFDDVRVDWWDKWASTESVEYRITIVSRRLHINLMHEYYFYIRQYPYE